MEVVYYVACSTDGFIAPEDGSLDWLAPFSRSGEDHGYAAFYESVDALIVGARTYEQMLSLGGWPHLDRPVTVMSARPLPAAADTVELSQLDPRAVLDRLEASGHERVWLMGGGALAGSFERAGLIGEYVLSYVPIVLGAGVGLFGGDAQMHPLLLIEHEAFADGIVQCHYRRDE